MLFSRIKGVGGSGAIPRILIVLMGRDGAGRAGRGGDGPPPDCGCGHREVLELTSNLNAHVP